MGIINDNYMSDIYLCNKISTPKAPKDVSVMDNNLCFSDYILDLPYELPLSPSLSDSLSSFPSQSPVPFELSDQSLFSDLSLLTTNHSITPVETGTKGRRRRKTSQKIYACSYCESTFTRINDLKRHTYRHNGQFPFLCNCGKGYYKLDLFLKHQLGHQTNNSCDKCGKTFTKRTDLARHYNTHWAKYICACGEGYSRKDLFFSHGRICKYSLK